MKIDLFLDAPWQQELFAEFMKKWAEKQREVNEQREKEYRELAMTRGALQGTAQAANWPMAVRQAIPDVAG